MSGRIGRWLGRAGLPVALVVLATAAAYGTLSDAVPMVASGQGRIVLEAGALAAGHLAQAATERLAHAAVGALVGSAKRATSSLAWVAKATPCLTSTGGRSRACPLRLTPARGSCPRCPTLPQRADTGFSATSRTS